VEDRARISRSSSKVRCSGLGGILHQFPEQIVDRYMTRKVKTVSCELLPV